MWLSYFSFRELKMLALIFQQHLKILLYGSSLMLFSHRRSCSLQHTRHYRARRIFRVAGKVDYQEPSHRDFLLFHIQWDCWGLLLHPKHKPCDHWAAKRWFHLWIVICDMLDIAQWLWIHQFLNLKLKRQNTRLITMLMQFNLVMFIPKADKLWMKIFTSLYGSVQCKKKLRYLTVITRISLNINSSLFIQIIKKYA